jgi:ribonucleoside-diphosphate reductase alpha chain
MIELVTKRDGSVVPFDADKLNMWAEYASNEGVSWSSVVLEAVDKLHNLIETRKIQQALVDVLISKKTEAAARMAAKLTIGDIYKQVHGGLWPSPFSQRYRQLVADGYWKDYNLTDEELARLEAEIDHDFDHTYEYASLHQWASRYALRRKSDEELVESPQETLMGIAICLFEHEKGDRVHQMLRYYRKSKPRKLNQATPILAASRTGENAQASCCVITAGDSIPSLMAAENVAFGMTAARAGLGVEFDIRSYGDIVGNNKCKHSGKIPQFNKLLHSIKSVTQGVRAGAATVSFNCMDPEFEDLIRLKRVTTPEDRRILLLDYSLVINNDFLSRVARNDDWMLVSKRVAPDLWHAFYEDRDAFPGIMQRYLDERKVGVGTVVKAREVLTAYIQSRYDTGRYYRFNVDNVNDHTPFRDVVRLSNLCQEIALVTKEYGSVMELFREYQDGDGITALCFLLAVDVAKIEDDEDYAETISIGQRALDNIIQHMHYPFPNIESTAKGFNSIGIGITNLAYLLAREDLTYSSEEGRNFIHRLSETHLYHSIKSSIELAKERGAFKFIDKTKWGDGYLPIDSYKREIDEHHSQPLLRDWESLRPQLRTYGCRFSTHVAHMPCESSSVFGYSTNGLYPIRQGILLKGKERLLFIAPEWERLQDKYEMAWDIATRDLYKCYGLVQKFSDQAISADTYVDFSQYPDGKVPLRESMSDFLFGNKIGMKTDYYLTPKTSFDLGGDEGTDPCGGACKM